MNISTYQVFFTEISEKEFSRLDKIVQRKVTKAVAQLEIDPFAPNVSKLTNHPEATYRKRIGDWRILFNIYPDNIIYIVRIWPRGKEYKK